MDERTLSEIVKGGESQTVEFKRAASKDVGRTICAFCNAGGGMLVIGIDDDGTFVGVQESKLDTIQQQIYHSQQECSPTPVCSISVVTVTNRKLVVVRVPQLGSGVCYYKNEIYIRVGTSDHKIAGPAIEDFLKKKQVLCFDDELTEAQVKDLDSDKIRDYVSQRNPQIPFQPEKLPAILATLRVATISGDFRLKKSAVLLFAKSGNQFIPQNQVKLARYKGVEAVDILDTVTLTGTVVENIDASMDFILKNIRKGLRIAGVRREEQWEYPVVALREAIVNAIVHRDYYSPAASQVNIFDNRIEITNPGALPRELKVEDLPFLGLGIPRNPNLYRLLSDINIVEGLGTGFPRMFRAMRDAGLPDPQAEDLGTLFKLTLFKKYPSFGKDAPNSRQQRAISYIREHKIITANRYVELYRVSKPTAINDLSGLVDKGLIKKVGKGRATHYVLKESSSAK